MAPTITASWTPHCKPFYHFTTLDAFKLILESHSLKMTSCENVRNAKTEAQSVKDAIIQLLKNEALSDKLKAKYKTESTEHIIDLLIKHRINTYMACFTTIQENEQLTNTSFNLHWEQYADKSRGVCIKFNFTYFPYMNSHSTSEMNHLSGSFERRPEARVCDMKYGEKNFLAELTKYKDDGSFDVFLVDSYKPETHKDEHEKRMLVYLDEPDRLQEINVDLDVHGGGVLTASHDLANGRPKCLFYTFAPEAIQSVYCVEKSTFSEVNDSINSQTGNIDVVLLDR